MAVSTRASIGMSTNVFDEGRLFHVRYFPFPGFLENRCKDFTEFIRMFFTASDGLNVGIRHRRHDKVSLPTALEAATEGGWVSPRGPPSACCSRTQLT